MSRFFAADKHAPSLLDRRAYQLYETSITEIMMMMIGRLQFRSVIVQRLPNLDILGDILDLRCPPLTLTVIILLAASPFSIGIHKSLSHKPR